MTQARSRSSSRTTSSTSTTEGTFGPLRRPRRRSDAARSARSDDASAAARRDVEDRARLDVRLQGAQARLGVVVLALRQVATEGAVEVSDREVSGIGWYVSDVHCRRAIGYLGAKLAEEGHLVSGFEQPLLLEFWGEALEATMDVDEASPIGPEQ
jgi:hypothetical protein